MNNVVIYKDPQCELFKDAIINFNENSYIVAINNKVIGHFNLLFNVLNNKKNVAIDYELLKEFRNQELGNLFYLLIENYVKENFDIDEIVLLIHWINIKSIKIAVKNNYVVDYNKLELMTNDGEMNSYNPYTKKLQIEK